MELKGFGYLEGKQRMAPAFTLVSGQGGKKVRLWDYKQRNPVVIYFLNGDEAAFLQRLDHEYPAYRRENAEMLVITALDADGVAKAGVKYPLLADPTRKVQADYIKLIQPDYNPATAKSLPVAVFVADRYGSLYRYATSHAPEYLPGQSEILAFLEFLGNLCNP